MSRLVKMEHSLFIGSVIMKILLLITYNSDYTKIFTENNIT